MIKRNQLSLRRIIIILVVLSSATLLLILPFFFNKNLISAQTGGPAIGPITVQTPGNIEKYAKFEISFNITNTAASNMYFPYDPLSPSGIDTTTGISVDMLLLNPGNSNWSDAIILPCFYYQPVQQIGSGNNIALSPLGKPEWRCRFTPGQTGTWQYRIRARDKTGTNESAINTFNAVNSTRKGFIRLSPQDNRYFEFSDGSPFTAPLVNTDLAQSTQQYVPDGNLINFRTNIPKMGQNGINFIRWFPTGEGGYVITYGDDIRSNWAFGYSGIKTDDVDTAMGNKFSFSPYYYSAQNFTLLPGAKYRMNFRARVTGEQVLRAELENLSNAVIDVCSDTNTLHTGCSVKKAGWQSYEIVGVNLNNLSSTLAAIRGLYVYSDAQAPYNTVRNGTIRISNITVSRDETGSNGWGSNLIARGDPDTYRYIDQIESAKLDDILTTSEQYNLYHKLTLFQKNDAVLNKFNASGTITGYAPCAWDPNNQNCFSPDHFYSADGQMIRWLERAYQRYFIARWSFSPAIHSIEFVNEADRYSLSQEANWKYGKFMKENTPRPLLVTTSFFGYTNEDFWTNTTYGQYFDYADQHWYANRTSGDNELISTQWQDTVTNIRQCYTRFKQFSNGFSYNKPVIRGETGVTISGTEPQDPAIAGETTGTYYHKKVWSQLGLGGYGCDGEWYPRLFETDGNYPNTTYNTYKTYTSYSKFMAGEQLASGMRTEIGSDLTGINQITVTSTIGSLRAFGSKDTATGNVLLWIDNSNHTWINVANNSSIPPASGTLTIQGMPSGTYQVQKWDTRSGTVSETSSTTVNSSGNLLFPVTDLTTDLAVKLINSNPPVTISPTYTPRCNPSGDTDCSGKVSVLDLSYLISKLGLSDFKADLNGDNKVNLNDLVTLLGNLGR